MCTSSRTASERLPRKHMNLGRGKPQCREIASLPENMPKTKAPHPHGNPSAEKSLAPINTYTSSKLKSFHGNKEQGTRCKPFFALTTRSLVIFGPYFSTEHSQCCLSDYEVGYTSISFQDQASLRCFDFLASTFHAHLRGFHSRCR